MRVAKWMVWVGLCLVPAAALATTRTIPYSGRLEANGQGPTGTYAMRFGLVRDAQADVSCLASASPPSSCAEWFDTYNAVDVIGGRFSVDLGGAARPISPDTLRSTDVAVVVAVKGPTDSGFVLLAGRHHLGAVPYAVVPEVTTPPIGSIVAWFPSIPGVPALDPADVWLRCDGQVVSDTASPLNGQTLPDLNGQRRFLRGGTTSGVDQEDALRTHKHLDSGHTHNFQRPPYFDAEITAGGLIRNPTGYAGTAYYPNTSVGNAQLGGPTEMDGTALVHQDMETRPRNTSVVWIMRVK